MTSSTNEIKSFNPWYTQTDLIAHVLSWDNLTDIGTAASVCKLWLAVCNRPDKDQVIFKPQALKLYPHYTVFPQQPPLQVATWRSICMTHLRIAQNRFHISSAVEADMGTMTTVVPIEGALRRDWMGFFEARLHPEPNPFPCIYRNMKTGKVLNMGRPFGRVVNVDIDVQQERFVRFLPAENPRWIISQGEVILSEIPLLQEHPPLFASYMGNELVAIYPCNQVAIWGLDPEGKIIGDQPTKTFVLQAIQDTTREANRFGYAIAGRWILVCSLGQDASTLEIRAYHRDTDETKILDFSDVAHLFVDKVPNLQAHLDADRLVLQLEPPFFPFKSTLWSEKNKSSQERRDNVIVRREYQLPDFTLLKNESINLDEILRKDSSKQIVNFYDVKDCGAFFLIICQHGRLKPSHMPGFSDREIGQASSVIVHEKATGKRNYIQGFNNIVNIDITDSSFTVFSLEYGKSDPLFVYRPFGLPDTLHNINHPQVLTRTTFDFASVSDARHGDFNISASLPASVLPKEEALLPLRDPKLRQQLEIDEEPILHLFVNQQVHQPLPSPVKKHRRIMLIAGVTLLILWVARSRFQFISQAFARFRR